MSNTERHLVGDATAGDGRTPRIRRWRDRLAGPFLGPLLAVTAWVGLAVWHPSTTYHLAPAAVVIAYPLLASGSGMSARRMTAAIVGSAGFAVLVAAGLAGLNLLKGPALFASAVGEAVMVTAVAGVLTLIVVRIRLRPRFFRDDECVSEQSVGD